MTQPLSPGSSPRIAVIVPNWNDSRYLPRCITSILNQEVPPDELILVDDKSTDDSVAVMRALVADRKDVQLIENPVNMGVYGAVDEALKRCRSEYILFLSANDFVLPGIFAHARAFISKYPGIGLWSAMGWHVDESDRPIKLHPAPVVARRDARFTPEQCQRLAWRYGNWFTGTTIIYRRAALDEIGGFDPLFRGVADLLAALAIASRHGALYSPVPYAVVRMHPDSYISKTRNDVSIREATIERLYERGPFMSQRLFTGAFMDRTSMRFRFATIRNSNGNGIAEIAARYAGWRRRALAWTDRLIPTGFWPARVLLAFLVLRPFDALPMIGTWFAVRIAIVKHSRSNRHSVRTPVT